VPLVERWPSSRTGRRTGPRIGLPNDLRIALAAEWPIERANGHVPERSP